MLITEADSRRLQFKPQFLLSLGWYLTFFSSLFRRIIRPKPTSGRFIQITQGELKKTFYFVLFQPYSFPPRFTKLKALKMTLTDTVAHRNLSYSHSDRHGLLPNICPIKTQCPRLLWLAFHTLKRRALSSQPAFQFGIGAVSTYRGRARGCDCHLYEPQSSLPDHGHQSPYLRNSNKPSKNLFEGLFCGCAH